MCVYGSKTNSYLYENTTNIETSSYDVESRRRKTGHYFLCKYLPWKKFKKNQINNIKHLKV